MAVIATEDDPSRHIAAGVISQLIEVASSQIDPADQAQWPSLQGPHNAQNAAVAIAVARALGLGDAGIAAALKSYSSLPHRMERIAERNGVLYVNDSRSEEHTSELQSLMRISYAVFCLKKKKKKQKHKTKITKI